jgi:hypothetical protein
LDQGTRVTRAPESVVQRGFSAGELAPTLHARADSPRYLDGLRTCRNFIVRKHGAVANRPGFRFVGECKTTSANVRLERYIDEDGYGVLVEVGEDYLRFYRNGAAIEDPPGTPVEVVTTYDTAGLIGGWEQSGNRIVITHRLHDPRELVYTDDVTWTLQLADTEPGITPPANLVLTNIAGGRTFQYLVTAVAEETYEESLPSNIETDAAIAAPTDAAPHVLAWDVHADAVEYNVYCDPYGNGVFGLIGVASSNSFNNPGLEPDFSLTPPIDRTPFVSADTRPHVSTHYQQRRFYAQSNANPQGIEGSRVGFPNNFGRSSPLQDDDGLTFSIVGKLYHPVRHILGLKRLCVMTDAGVWLVGKEQEPLTPSTLNADQHGYSGVAADVRPVVIGESVIYAQKSKKIIRDLRFDQQVDGLAGRDVTVFGAHLFEGHEIDRMDFQEAPDSIVWCVRDDGVLLGMTYSREYDMMAWHRHDTDGDFEQICVVPEPDGDVLYAIVRRTIGGVSKRYIERMEQRDIREGFFNLDSFFVDSGLTYDGAPATTFTGLDHLEGERIAVLADGNVISNGQDETEITVTGGGFTLATAASRVHAGLPIGRAQIETLDLDAHGTPVRDKQKRQGSVNVLLDRSSRTFSAGPDEDNLTPYELGRLDEEGDEYTGAVEMTLKGDWSRPGRVLIWQKDPLPITILGIIPNQVIGG